MQATQRLLALDVFRGATIAFMILVNTPGTWSHVFAPLLHAPWHGCTPTDLVFPNFVFIVGVAIAYSFAKFDYRASRGALLKVARRTLLIFGIGLLLNWFPFFQTPLDELRVFGVLQRIALAYGFTATLCLLLPRRMWGVGFVGLLLLYWAMLYWGGGLAPYSLEDNLVRAVDLAILKPDHLYGGFGIPFDPEGLVGALGTAASVLLGAIVGLRIRNTEDRGVLVRELFLLGLALTATGLLWDYVLPINKPLWTSSYVVYAGGIATMLLATCIELIDLRGYRGWTKPFVVFGTNPLAIYVLSGLIVKVMLYLIRWQNAAGESINAYGWLYNSVILAAVPFPKLASLLFAFSVVLVCYVVAYILYRRSIFIKV